MKLICYSFLLLAAFYPPLVARATAAAADELAAQLFAVGGIYNVFMVQDFITINKYPDTPWESLTGQLERIIVAYFGNQP